MVSKLWAVSSVTVGHHYGQLMTAAHAQQLLLANSCTVH